MDFAESMLLGVPKTVPLKTQYRTELVERIT
jgi:hypothetical protein